MHFRLALTLCALLSLVGCDEVTSLDATREQAEASGSIARGWLPGILPHSATSIKTTNNLDRNTSQASFAFNPEEWDSFATHLAPLVPTEPPYEGWDSTVKSYQSQGYEAKIFESQQSHWIFFCKPAEGRCESFMWLKRGHAATVQVAP